MSGESLSKKSSTERPRGASRSCCAKRAAGLQEELSLMALLAAVRPRRLLAAGPWFIHAHMPVHAAAGVLPAMPGHDQRANDRRRDQRESGPESNNREQGHFTAHEN